MVGLFNIPIFYHYMFRFPNFISVYKNCVNICELDMSGLDFRVNSRLGGYIFWFDIDFNFLLLL
jgi:hypothetical protein